MAGRAKLSDWIVVGVCLLIFYWIANKFFDINSAFAFSVFLIGLLIYFAPSLIAGKNGKKNTTAIFALNFFLGWTFLGWVVALVWACMED